MASAQHLRKPNLAGLDVIRNDCGFPMSDNKFAGFHI